MKEIIEKLKKAEKELIRIQESSWSKIPGNLTVGKSYVTNSKNLLSKDDIKKLKECLKIDDWADLVEGCLINYSETDLSDEPFIWKHHMNHSFNYYIEKLETFDK